MIIFEFKINAFKIQSGENPRVVSRLPTSTLQFVSTTAS